MTYKTTEIFIESGEIIERDSTAEEIAVTNALREKRKAIESEAKAKESAKESLLAKLGITAEEAKLLLS